MVVPEILGWIYVQRAVSYCIRRFRLILLLGVALVYTELAAANAIVVVSTKYNPFIIRNRWSSSLKFVVVDAAQRHTIEFLTSLPDLILERRPEPHQIPVKTDELFWVETL